MLYTNFARDTQAVVDMYRVGLRRRDITIRCTERLHLEERRHRCVDRQRDTHPKSVDPNDLFREHAMSRETLKYNTGEGLRNEGSVAVSFRGLRIARESQSAAIMRDDNMNKHSLNGDQCAHKHSLDGDPGARDECVLGI